MLVAGGLMLLGLPAAGSATFALGWCALGVMFAGVAALTAQLTTSARTANGLAIAVLGLCYLIRAAGDAGGSDGPTWLLWLTPFGWVSHLRPYTGNHWWVLPSPFRGDRDVAGVRCERPDLDAGGAAGQGERGGGRRAGR